MNVGKELTEYLHNIVDLEKSIYVQQHTISKLKWHTTLLGMRKRIEEPEPFKECEYVSTKSIGPSALLGIFLGVIVGTLMDSFSVGVITAGITAVLWTLLMDNSTISEENKKRREKYEKEKEAYDQKLMSECLRLDQENARKQSLNDILRTMEEKLQNTKSVLQKYYSMDIIFPKYRNLVAMCSIYEYILSGRCKELTGFEGAYNTYETETQFNRIYTKLDEVVSKLEEIKSNQFMLYNAIQDGNRMTQKLVNASMEQTKYAEQIANSVEAAALHSEQIANNTALAAYYNQQTAIEAKQLKWLMSNDPGRRKIY